MTGAHVPASLERRVRLRAGHRCEYCRLSQARQEATFHVDHVIPLRQGGTTTLDNLSLACVSCSLRKGARVTARDPASGKEVRIFNPRAQAFRDHFAVLENGKLMGKTPAGRATIDLLRMNRDLAIELRLEEKARGRYP